MNRFDCFTKMKTKTNPVGTRHTLLSLSVLHNKREIESRDFCVVMTFGTRKTFKNSKFKLRGNERDVAARETFWFRVLNSQNRRECVSCQCTNWRNTFAVWCEWRQVSFMTSTNHSVQCHWPIGDCRRICSGQTTTSDDSFTQSTQVASIRQLLWREREGVMRTMPIVSPMR